MASTGVRRSAQIPHSRMTTLPRIVRKRFLRQTEMIPLIIASSFPDYFPPFPA